jgi:hypothetical protein
MGMFDYLVCDDPLPVAGFEKVKFQTKSLWSKMDLYKISEGKLYKQRDFDSERTNDEEMWKAACDGPGTLAPCMSSITFYHFGGITQGYVVFKATFVTGKLEGPIELVEHHDPNKADEEFLKFQDKMFKHAERVLHCYGPAPIKPADYEPYIIKELNDIPLGALKAFIDGAEEGVSTAIAEHPTHGYAVIQTAGQGPIIVWQPGQGLAKAFSEFYIRNLKAPTLTQRIMAMANTVSKPIPEDIRKQLEDDVHVYGAAYAHLKDGKWERINPPDMLVMNNHHPRKE